MFHLFRSRKQTFRILLGVIVAPIIITMVVTLIPGIFGSSGTSTGTDADLAEVAGEPITVREAQAELQDYVKIQRPPPGTYQFVAPQIVQELVTGQALLYEAERLGLGVSESELVETLKTGLPFLFPGGNFAGNDAYAAFVQERFQKSIPEFEALFRKDLVITKLRHLLTDDVTVTTAELEQEFKRREEKARIEFVAVTPASVQSSVSSTPAEVEEYFKKNRAVYMAPEKRSFQYMVIDDAKLASRVQISRQEVERYYNENKDRFRVQDRVHATHILFKTTDKTPDEIKKIEAKAQDVLKQVRAGKDFAALAKANSEDTGSGQKGGDIGWVTRTQTLPEFEQKAFSMKPGEISDLVKTQVGFHIIKALEREQARLRPFEEVQPTIREELTKDRVEVEKSRLLDAARAAASRHVQNLEDAGREVGLPVSTVARMERGKPIPEVAVTPALGEALFSALKGTVVGPVQMAGKSMIAVVTEIVPTRQAELAEVTERAKNDCNLAKARDAAEARAKQLAERARALGDLKKAAKEFKLEAKTSELFTREGSIPGLGSAAIVREAFTAPSHSILGPVIAGSDRVAYQVVEHAPADMAQFAKQRTTIHDQLLGNQQNEAWEIFRQELRERLKRQGKIKIYQDRVDRFVAANRG